MKPKSCLFLVIVLLVFSSCNNDGIMEKNNLSPSSLDFKAAIRTAPPSSSASKAAQSTSADTILLFTGKDIAWFNETTGELRFNDNFSGIEVAGFNTSVDLLVYSDNESLYSINYILTSDVMSWVVNSPVIYKGVGVSACYVKNGYPDRNLADLDKDDPWRIEREANWNKLVQSDGWQRFVLQLKKEGRYRK